MLFPDGRRGWLITDRELARSLLTDSRFSARAGHTREPTTPIEPGLFIRMDPPDHTHYRRLLTAQFTVRGMKQLTPRVEQIVHEHVDAMAAAGPPADLVRCFALPVPSMVICELLGVPYTDRERFQRATAALLDIDADVQEAESAYRDISDYLADLIAHKQENPSDDLLSGLVSETDLSHQELVHIAFLLLSAGHETTANMLGLGTFVLLQHPDQRDLLYREPDRIDSAVEELLRYTSILQFFVNRMALQDVELGGVRIEAGQVVMLSLPMVNRDPNRFPDPERLDITRRPGGHLSFGHGVHQCLGQQLARVEMRVGYAALFDRFPSLALTVPAEQVPMRTDKAIYGVHRLPVTW